MTSTHPPVCWNPLLTDQRSKGRGRRGPCVALGARVAAVTGRPRSAAEIPFAAISVLASLGALIAALVTAASLIPLAARGAAEVPAAA